MRRINLRLLDTDPLNKSEKELLINVRKKVEEILSINWLQEPSLHPKGGYTIIGETSKDIDFDSLPFKLKNAGFIAVI